MQPRAETFIYKSSTRHQEPCAIQDAQLRMNRQPIVACSARQGSFYTQQALAFLLIPRLDIPSLPVPLKNQDLSFWLLLTTCSLLCSSTSRNSGTSNCSIASALS